jgi:hypothetical protein
LQDLIFLLKGKGLYLVANNLPELRVPLVNHQELIIDHLFLVFLVFLGLIIGRLSLRLLFKDVMIRVIGSIWLVFRCRLIFLLFLIIEIVSEIIVNEEAIIFFLLLILCGSRHRIKDRLLFHRFKYDLFILIVFEGTLYLLVEWVLFLLGRWLRRGRFG